MLSEAKSRFAGVIKSLFFSFFFLFLIAEIYPQWVQTNGPYGGYVTALAVCGDNIFVGTGGFTYDGGIYRSTNDGESWTEVTNGLTNKWINKISIYTGNEKDTIIFAGTQFGGVFRSTNLGESWDEVNSGLPDNKWITSFAFNGKNIFTGLYYGGVFISTDNGTSWTSSGLSDKQVVALTVTSDGNLFAGTEFEGVFLSTDDGINWTSACSGLSKDKHIVTFASIGTNLFAGTAYGDPGIFLSTNNGASWTPVNSGLPPNSDVSSLAVCDTSLLAGTMDNYNSQGGVYLSTDNGKHWSLKGLKNKDIRALAVNSNNAGAINIFAGVASNGGVFLSTDIGKRWEEVNKGISHTNVLSLTVFPKNDGSMNIFAGTMNNGAFLSNDNGKSWLSIDSGLGYQYGMPGVNSFIVNEQNIFAGTSNGLFLSTDNGANWGPVNSGIPQYTSVYALTSSGTNLYAGTYSNGVFLSKNNGASWSKVNLVLPLYTTVYSLLVDGTSLFAGTDIGGIFLSTNDGVSWASIGLTNMDIRALAVNFDETGKKNLFAGTSCDGVFLSTDGGINWTAKNEGLPQDQYGYYYSINVFAVNGTNIFVGTTNLINEYTGTNCRLFLSTNYGASWTAADSGLAHTDVLSLIISQDEAGALNLFAGTGSGVWKCPLSEMITGVENKTELPKNFSLGQNYPNPFNPTTTLSFVIGHLSLVSLRVYDLLGREVATIVNEEKAAGRYDLTWNATNLPSGVYFYQLKAGNYSATKKLLLLK